MDEPLRTLVNVESPCAGIGETRWQRAVSRWRHRMYTIQVVRDSLARGEAPYASHAMFDSSRILNDDKPDDRALGMGVGDAWARLAALHVFYVDLGMSRGMLRRWDECVVNGWRRELRWLDADNRRKYHAQLVTQLAERHVQRVA